MESSIAALENNKLTTVKSLRELEDQDLINFGLSESLVKKIRKRLEETPVTFARV